ncbi:MAG: hypothetical protein IAE79_27490, partial [Anaerolinea sp.]|nr:hypothetical protein [Anaerolinea sp.]
MAERVISSIQTWMGMTAVPLPPLIINAQGRGTAVSPYRASQDDGRQTRFLLTDGLGSV